jgi:hypothetical protein
VVDRLQRTGRAHSNLILGDVAMSKDHFRASDYLNKPAKPCEVFLLFPHNNGVLPKLD